MWWRQSSALNKQLLRIYQPVNIGSRKKIKRFSEDSSSVKKFLTRTLLKENSWLVLERRETKQPTKREQFAFFDMREPQTIERSVPTKSFSKFFGPFVFWGTRVAKKYTKKRKNFTGISFWKSPFKTPNCRQIKICNFCRLNCKN